MTLAPITANSKATYLRGQWPVLLLVAAVLLPTACVLWMINEAVRNQGLAVRQKLSDAYQSQLSLVRERLDEAWSRKVAVLESFPADASAFAQVIKSGLADSAVIRDSAGALVYPSPAQRPAADPARGQPEWARARQLEETDLKAAASVYLSLERTAKGPGVSARATQAAARCLAQAGQQENAARLLVARFARPGPAPANDPQARAIAANALLMAIHFLKPDDPSRLATARRLHDLLGDYSHPL